MKINIASISVNQIPFDWDGNLNNIIDGFYEALNNNAHLISFPELAISGYGGEDSHNSVELQENGIQNLSKLCSVLYSLYVKDDKLSIVSVGIPIFYEHCLYNSVCFIVNGRIVGFDCKKDLAGDGVHYEARWFHAWPAGSAARYWHPKLSQHFLQKNVPFGDVYFKLKDDTLGSITIGHEICEEAWVLQRRGARFNGNADIIINPSASHFAKGKYEKRINIEKEGSRAANCVGVYTPLLGNESGKVIYDGGSIITNNGQVIALGKRFSIKRYEITYASVDLDILRSVHSKVSSFNPHVDNNYQPIEIDFRFEQISMKKNTWTLYDYWYNNVDNRDFEEFTRATALGFLDYMRKAKLHGYVVSLSGGRDSSLTVCLIYYMVLLALEGGHKEFVRLFGYIPFVQDMLQHGKIFSDLQANYITNRLLTTIYQATENSSEDTKEAARKLSKEVGAKHFEISVQPEFNIVRENLEKLYGRSLSFDNKEDDLVLQNLQARVRVPNLWAIANMENKTIVYTGNRSEASVGYCSIDGDTAGAIGGICGVDKEFIIKWLDWIFLTGASFLGKKQPLNSLKYVTNLEPSAELRPSSSVQTDETDLMPFSLLTKIERYFLVDKQMPKSILARISEELNSARDYETCKTLADNITKFFSLWCRNQYKRERLPRGFHLDDLNDDPTTWNRFPMLSSGFQKEIQEMYDSIKELIKK